MGCYHHLLYLLLPLVSSTWGPGVYKIPIQSLQWKQRSVVHGLFMSLLSILRIYFLTGTGVFITFLLIFEIEIQAVVTFLINVSSVMRSRKNSQENIFHGIFSIKLQNLGLWKNTLMPNVLINDLATTPYSVTAGLILENKNMRADWGL